jgi:hypothetical protein
MRNAELLKELGWSNELIEAVSSVASALDATANSIHAIESEPIILTQTTSTQLIVTESVAA